MDVIHRPRWVRDLARFLPLKSQFVLTGNVKDLQFHSIAGTVTTASMSEVIVATLTEAGYSDVIHYDPIRGFELLPRPDGTTSRPTLLTDLGLTPENNVAPAGLTLISQTLERIVQFEGDPIALIVNFASRLVVRSDSLSQAEHQLFTRALILSQNAKARPAGADRQPRFNTILWILDKEGDVPDWFTIHNPRLRHIPLARPDRATRRALAPSMVRSLPNAREASAETVKVAEDALVDGTDGLLLTDLRSIVQLARSEGVGLDNLGEAVRRYKVGVTEDAWRLLEHARIRNGAEILRERVVGQDHAVIHMLDIVKRAATGIGRNKRGGRPRGVAFFAGPTGVGKTELAKAVTQLLFGDESAYIRFDMSEFSAEHADQRLIGAPPGYVGYDLGGELTNAVREKPFSVVLFDEIEKAHPRILDKFLQILDDGVLTSGRGDRVYFSESLIIFTSNLGIYSSEPDGTRIANVRSDQPFEDVRAKVKSEIESYFKVVLNRPEILNRFGENIIVFDFIRPEIADQIFASMVEAALEDASSSSYDVRIGDRARETLRSLCTSDLSNGGRGIRNKIEAHLINPLARALFDRETPGPVLIECIESGAATNLVLKEHM